MDGITNILNRLEPSKKVLILGSAFVDLVIRVDKLPCSGADIPGIFQNAKVGGCSFNVSDVLSKLKLPFEALMPVGEGMISEIVKAEFTKRGYPLAVYPGCDCGWCLSLVEADGERTFVTMDGIEKKFELSWFDSLKAADFDFIYLSGYQMEGENALVICEALKEISDKTTLVYDPGPRSAFIDPKITAFLEDRHCMYTINEGEAKILSGRDKLEEAGKTLYARTQKAAVVTSGGNGAYIFDAAGTRHIPGFKITVCDTIGSGDAHTGGIIAGLMCDLSLDEAVLLANRTAASVTAHEGAASCESLEELKADPEGRLLA